MTFFEPLVAEHIHLGGGNIFLNENSYVYFLGTYPTEGKKKSISLSLMCGFLRITLESISCCEAFTACNDFLIVSRLFLVTT